MVEKRKISDLLMVQKPMTQVVYALLPLSLASVWFFGWRAVLVLLTANVTGFLCEAVFARISKTKVTSSVFVTAFLFALSMPPSIPLWIVVIGMVFGIVFAKMVFGGFGRNVFNPAITGRAFVYTSFGVQLTGQFSPAFSGFPGGFGAWAPGIDTVTKATPLLNLTVEQKWTGAEQLFDLFIGSTSGSLGETSILLIILCGAWLMFKKTANYRLALGTLGGFAVTQTLLFFIPGTGALDPAAGLLSGSVMFAAMFMATDPVSSSQTTNKGRWIYGLGIGILTSLIRTFSIWPEGVSFAILLANMFAPLLNHLIVQSNKKRKAAKA